MNLVALLLAFTGFATLALAMDRHYRQVWQRSPSVRQRRWLRALGIIGLALSLAICGANVGWSAGFVLWFGMLSVTALIVVLLLTVRAHNTSNTESRRYPPNRKSL